MPVLARGVREDVVLAHGDDVDGRGDGLGLPNERAVGRVEAPDVPVLGSVAGPVVSTQVEPSVGRRDGAAGGHVVVGGRPEDLAGGRIERGGDASRARLPASLGGVAEEGRVIEHAVGQAHARVVAAGPQAGEVLLPHLPARVEVPRPQKRLVVHRVVRVVVGVDPARHLGPVGRRHRIATMDEGLLGPLRCVSAGAKAVDGQVVVQDRRPLAAPARRAGERRFPQELAGGRFEAPQPRLLYPRLGHQEPLLVVDRRGERQVDMGEVAPPEEPAGFLLDGEYLAFGRVGVHPAAPADRQVLERPLVASDPLDGKRGFHPLVVGVGAGEVAVVGEPVVLAVGQFAGERVANLPHPEVFGRQRGLAAGPQHVEVAVFTAEVHPALRHAGRGRDGAAEGGLERPRFALAR